uniref:Uncharacterized protein n=1 Tax=Crocodylus porosus TaxID=8502 RepID=A0A7M4E8T6_CROPO
TAGHILDKEAADAYALHQDQKFCETVPKELCCQQLNTHFGFNLWCHVHVITRKPVSGHGNMEEPVDPKDLNLIHHAALESTKKYSEPGPEGCGAEQTHLLFIGRKRWSKRKKSFSPVTALIGWLPCLSTSWGRAANQKTVSCR